MVEASTSPRQIKIDIISDTICPFCYIGKRKLDKALEIAKEKDLNIEVKRQFHPFLLDPSLKSAQDKSERNVQKFGQTRYEQVQKMLNERGLESGIHFSFGGKMSQTIDSHRLIALAYEKGGEEMQLDFIERLYGGYFEREKDNGCPYFLSDQAVAAKIFSTTEEAKAWLATDEKKQQVVAEITKASHMGITGVPFFVVDHRYAISGAEEPEVFVQVFEKLAASEVITPASVKAK